MAVSIFMEGRSPCPVCGAPMTPGTTEHVAACEWCGTRSYVVRRLRTVEPLTTGGFEPGLIVDVSTEAADSATPAGCPGCGVPLTTTLAQEIVQCPQCGAHTKIERRLCANRVGDAADYHEPTHRFGWQRKRRLKRDRARDDVIRRALDDATLHVRVRLIQRLTPWESLSAEREELFTRLLDEAQADPLMDRVACGLVHRFLQMGKQAGGGFEQHPWRYFVLRCSARVAFRPEASGRLVMELKQVRGGGAALKLLLDIADYALAIDEVGYAADALDAIDATVSDSFNWTHRDRMHDVMAYRLLHIDERLAAYLLSQVGPYWMTMLKPRVVSRLVDDCVQERPEMAAALANLAGSAACPAGEYREHLEFVRELFTPPGRALALQALVCAPGGAVKNMTHDAVSLILGWLEEARAEQESEIAAVRVLRWWADDLAEHAPDLVPGLVEPLRTSLPEMPQWPPPPLPNDYQEELEALAFSLAYDVERRSSSTTEDPELDDPAARERRAELERSVDVAERERRTQVIEQNWGYWRRGRQR